MIFLSFTWGGKLPWHNATEFFQLGKLDKKRSGRLPEPGE